MFWSAMRRGRAFVQVVSTGHKNHRQRSRKTRNARTGISTLAGVGGTREKSGPAPVRSILPILSLLRCVELERSQDVQRLAFDGGAKK